MEKNNNMQTYLKVIVFLISQIYKKHFGSCNKIHIRSLRCRISTVLRVLGSHTQNCFNRRSTEIQRNHRLLRTGFQRQPMLCASVYILNHGDGIQVYNLKYLAVPSQKQQQLRRCQRFQVYVMIIFLVIFTHSHSSITQTPYQILHYDIVIVQC